MWPSSLRVASCVNTGSSTCLIQVWCGGSTLTGGASTICWGRSLRTTTRREENAFQLSITSRAAW